MLDVSWDPVLIAISFLVAFIASFVALDSAGKISGASRKAAFWWQMAGGITLGIGVWSMHFIGMLSMKMPMAMSYDFGSPRPRLASLYWPPPALSILRYPVMPFLFYDGFPL